MQLHWLQVLSTYRNPFFNFFFKVLHFFDTAYFAFLLLAFIWFAFSHKWGIRLLYLSYLNALINFLLKLIFKIPRPSIVDPSLGLINVGEFSFPSGAAQYSMLLGCILIYYNKSIWAKIVGVSYILLMGFSRMYLGVHYPTDILGGWVVGVTLFLIFKKVLPIVEKKIPKKPILNLAVFVVAMVLLNILMSSQKILILSSVLIFGSIGVYISVKYNLYLNERKKLVIRLIRSIFAIGGAFIILGIISLAPTYGFFKTYFSASMFTLWITLIASPIINRIKYLN